MNKNIMDNFKNLKYIFERYPEIKLVYIFGSKAKNKGGPLSDYDFAVYFDEKDKNKMFKIKFQLFNDISRFLKTDKVDIVILNLSLSPELKYNIIKEGKLVYEKEPFKTLLEPKIFNDYFDFRYLLRKNNLTKA